MKATTKLLLLAVFLCAICNDAFSQWTKTVNFESGTNGSIANTTSGFDYAGTATTFSSDMAASGSKSAKMIWPKGLEGWGICHGEINYPTRVTNGGEIWVRGYYFFASPWSWVSNIGQYSGVKVLRIATDVGGWHSIFAMGPNIVASNEMAEIQVTTSAPFSINQWQCLEIYLKLSPTAGIMRIWKDGALIYEDLAHKTITTANGYVAFSSMMSVWNNGVGQNQTNYIDDFIITNTTPSKVDSKGNPMIGPNGGSSCGGPDPWTNTSFTQQTGAFTADFDVIPSGNNVDGVVGLSNASAGAYTDLACIVRFNTNGNIDARNGASYQAANTVPYIAGTSYHVKMNVNLNTKKYDVYVTPQGGSQQTIASQYDFRTEQNTVSQLNNWAKNTASCSLDVKNFTSGITTSVKDNLNNTTIQMTIYPNPATEQLIIEISSTEAKTISILDLLGRELINENVTEAQTTLDVTGLTEGIYMIIIRDKNGNKLSAEKISVENR